MMAPLLPTAEMVAKLEREGGREGGREEGFRGGGKGMFSSLS